MALHLGFDTSCWETWVGSNKEIIILVKKMRNSQNMTRQDLRGSAILPTSTGQHREYFYY